MTLRETGCAIKCVKDTFERTFATALGLERVSAPMFVPADSGLNDDLNGVERPVRFDVKEISEYDAEVVQSLAKWKRLALRNYGFGMGEGLYTDMNAIRRDDTMDNIHSIYVDQWDWEKIVSRDQRNVDFLKTTVRKIVAAIVETQNAVKSEFPFLATNLNPEVHFITAQELLDRYPDLPSKQRERVIVEEKKTVFLMNIGDALSNGEPHDGRAPDYDDWTLNGDLLFWNDFTSDALEISSMGIRVDAEALVRQLTIRNKLDRLAYEYHSLIKNEQMPLTIGGGIGQSRLCMLLLRKLHIGEVQSSLWPPAMIAECEKAGIRLL